VKNDYRLHHYPSEKQMRNARRYYLKYFHPHGEVLDLGCGRGEFLELLRQSNRCGQGVEVDARIANICRQKGLDVIQGDVIDFLDGMAAEKECTISQLSLAWCVQKPGITSFRLSSIFMGEVSGPEEVAVPSMMDLPWHPRELFL